MILQITELDLHGTDHTLYKQIQDSSSLIEERVTKMKEQKDPNVQTASDGVIFYKNTIYVPKDDALRADILWSCHNTPSASHPGIWKMQELVERNYWWPSLRSDVKKYVQGCDTCQRVKIDRTKRTAPLHPHDVPEQPFDTVAADFIGPLPPSGEFNFICVITCMLTKYVIYTPCKHTIDSEEFARLYHDNVYAYFGMPRKLITDRGPQFVSMFSKALFHLEGIQGNPSTAYHPQTDGQMERVNQELEQYLCLYVNHRQSDWAD